MKNWKILNWCNLFWVTFFTLCAFIYIDVTGTPLSSDSDNLHGVVAKSGYLEFDKRITAPTVIDSNKMVLFSQQPIGEDVGLFASASTPTGLQRLITPRDVSNLFFYAEMYVNDQTLDIEIREANEWYPVMGLQAGILDGTTWVFGTSKRNIAISSTADAGGGQVTVTSNSHGLSDGDIVYLTSINNYEGVYKISDVTTNTFEITATYTGNENGYFNAPSYLECDDGIVESVIYKITVSLSASPEDMNHRFEFAIFVDDVMVDSSLQRNGTWTSSDYSVIPLQALSEIDCTFNEKVSIAVRNISGNKDITIRNANVSIISLI